MMSLISAHHIMKRCVFLQIDTTSGDVTVSASQFSGIASIVTAGSITCSGGGFSASSPCATVSESSLNVAEQVIYFHFFAALQKANVAVCYCRC